MANKENALALTGQLGPGLSRSQLISARESQLLSERADLTAYVKTLEQKLLQEKTGGNLQNKELVQQVCKHARQQHQHEDSSMYSARPPRCQTTGAGPICGVANALPAARALPRSQTTLVFLTRRRQAVCMHS